MSVKGSGLANASITFDGAPASPLSQSDSEVRLQLPPHDNGYAFIAAASAGATAYGRFLYVPPKLDELPPGYITTVAGIGSYNGQYGSARSASLSQPWGLTLDANGILYFCDTPRNRVLRIRDDGILEPFAGDGTTRTVRLTAPAPALTVSMAFPRSIAFDTHGNLIVPDANYFLYRVDPNGVAEPIAGTGVAATTAPEGVPAKGTPVGIISYVAVDRDDNVHFIDWDRARIRKIDRNGILTTVAGTGTFGFSGDGGPATSAQFNLEFVDEGDLKLDSAGNLVFIDYKNNRVRRINKASGIIETIVGPTVNGSNLNDLRAIALDANDALYFANATVIRRRSVDGTIAVIASQNGFSDDGARYPNAANGIVKGMVVDREGNLIFSEDDVRRVRRVDHVTQALTTLAGIGPLAFGEGGPAIAASFQTPLLDLDFLPDGELLISDTDRIDSLGDDGVLRRYAGSGVPSPFSGVDRFQAAMRPSSVSVASDGTIELTSGIIFRIDRDGIVRVTAGRFTSCALAGDGGTATEAVLCQPWDALRDGGGNVFIADTNNNRVRRVDHRTGLIDTFAGSGPVNGLERYGFGTTCGDGAAATGACINTPYGLAMDDSNNLYVCENGQRIRKIDSAGRIMTLAEERCTKLAWAFGNLYMVASDHVSRISPTGEITLLTARNLGFGGDGGPASSASVFAQKQSHGIAIDRDGNLFFVDGDNLRVRAIRYGAVLTPPNATLSLSRSGSMLQATVLDPGGHPAPSVRVDFGVPAAGASCSLSSAFAITDANGRATVACTPNCVAGAYSVTARPINSSANAAVTLTNAGPPCRQRAVRH